MDLNFGINRFQFKDKITTNEKGNLITMDVSKMVKEIVIHKKFGKGTIISFDTKNLEVEFESVGVKKFVFPTSFNGFLTFENKELQSQIQQIVSDWKVETGVDKSEKFQEDYNKLQNEMKERRLALKKDVWKQPEQADGIC